MTNKIITRPVIPRYESPEALKRLDRHELTSRLTKVDNILNRSTQRLTMEVNQRRIAPGTILRVTTRKDEIFHVRYEKHLTTKEDVVILPTLSHRQKPVAEHLYPTFAKATAPFNVTYVPTTLTGGFAASNVKTVHYLDITDKKVKTIDGKKRIVDGKAEYKELFNAAKREETLAQKQRIERVIKERKPYIAPEVTPKTQVVRFHMGKSKIKLPF